MYFLKININLSYAPEVAAFISRSPETKKYGARPLKRLISDKIENIITEYIINDKISSGDDVYLDIKDSEIFVKKAIKKQLI